MQNRGAGKWGSGEEWVIVEDGRRDKSIPERAGVRTRQLSFYLPVIALGKFVPVPSSISSAH
jgi:hypothetical protein